MEIWFEFGSTYSYPAVLRVGTLTEEALLRPFLLGPIFRDLGWNDSPFNLQPAKGRYMWRDLERLCAKYGLPFRRPSRFPRNGLLAARVALAAAGEPWRDEFVRRVYTANFAEDREISEPGVVASLVEAASGGEAAGWLERAATPTVKEALRANTEEARRLGIFGAPTAVVAGELFWGDDRLEDAVAWERRVGA